MQLKEIAYSDLSKVWKVLARSKSFGFETVPNFQSLTFFWSLLYMTVQEIYKSVSIASKSFLKVSVL